MRWKSACLLAGSILVLVAATVLDVIDELLIGKVVSVIANEGGGPLSKGSILKDTCRVVKNSTSADDLRTAK